MELRVEGDRRLQHAGWRSDSQHQRKETENVPGRALTQALLPHPVQTSSYEQVDPAQMLGFCFLRKVIPLMAEGLKEMCPGPCWATTASSVSSMSLPHCVSLIKPRHGKEALWGFSLGPHSPTWTSSPAWSVN